MFSSFFSKSPDSSDSSHTDEEKKIRKEQLNMLYSGLTNSLPVSLVIAIVIVFVQRNVIQHEVLFWWLAAFVTILIIRSISAYLYLKNKLTRYSTQDWFYLFTLGAYLSAFVWGSVAWFLYPYDSIAHQTFLATIIAGLAAGAVTTLSASLRVVIPFLLIAILPLIVRLLMSGIEVTIILGWLILLFLIGIISGCRQINQNIIQNMQLRFQSIKREESLKKSEQKLFESEEKYRLLFELSEDPMWIIVDKKFVLTNNSALKTLGYASMDELLNIHPSKVSPEFQEDGQESYSKTETMFKLAYEKGYHRFEWLHQKKNNDVFPVSISLTRIPFAGQNALFCIWRDISERKAAENAAHKAQLLAEQASKAKSQFLATMSHEIRTPMNGILGMSELLSISKLNAEQQEFVKTIHHSGQNLLVIINDILDFSKVEAGQMELDLGPIDLKQSFTDIIQLLSPKTNEKLLQLQLKYPSDIPTLFIADAARIRQVLINLISNAIKFTEKGTIQVNVINQSIDKHSIQLKIEVVDSGIGISPQLKDKLFDSFTQADSSTTRKFGGTGLGLAISKKLVELMNGTIGYESTPNLGSTFWFELSLAFADTPLQEQYNSTPVSSMEQIDPNNITKTDLNKTNNIQILLVEDEKVNQKVASTFLKRLGIYCDIAADGAQALNQFQIKNYDLIFMDCQMPIMDGFETTQKIREVEGESQHTPIIALTANALESDRQKCMAVGMDDFISKPFKMAELETILDRWVNNKNN